MQGAFVEVKGRVLKSAASDIPDSLASIPIVHIGLDLIVFIADLFLRPEYSLATPVSTRLQRLYNA